MRRVLVVDDEPHIRTVLRRYLEADGLTVAEAADGEAALAALRENPPDLVLLDVMLPGIDGIEVLRQLRSFSDAYVILVTARTEEIDKLVGLGVGADDYVTKPFSPREVTARVKAMLRRPRAETPADEAPRRFGRLVISPAGREATIDDVPVELTRTEFDLLAALSARPKLAFSRTQLIHAVWGEDWVGDEHLVDVHIGHLRRKLGDDAAAPRFIRTVRSIGYRMGGG